MPESLADGSLDQLFRTARTRNRWRTEILSEALLHAVYDLAKWGPTSANVSPARFVFVASDEAKARLAPHLSSANRPKMLAAPVCVIVAHDLDFAQHLPTLFPHQPGAKDWFSDPEVERTTALRNGTLQGAYLMIAARSLGLDCGPMSGFDNAGVDEAFFPGARIRSNFICNIGHGTDEGLFDRLPRLSFETACSIV
jgi:3-hydroxypropanoate dehydrogenase